MANYGIDKLEKAAKILTGVCVAVVGAGLAILSHVNMKDDDSAVKDKKEQTDRKKSNCKH